MTNTGKHDSGESAIETSSTINHIADCVETDAVAIPVTVVEPDDNATIFSGITHASAPQEDEMPIAAAKQCTVIAPQTLHEGYVFRALVDGIEFDVTVPQGGVVEGQRFQVPYPARPPSQHHPGGSTAGQTVASSTTSNPYPPAPNAVPNNNNNNNNNNNSNTATTNPPPPPNADTTAVYNPAAAQNRAALGPYDGDWRHDLFDCCGVLANGLFWNAWCCLPILFGQLAQRMKLNPCGFKARFVGDYQYTFYVLLAVWLITLILCVIVKKSICFWIFYIYFLIVVTNTRYQYRQVYHIEEKHCAGCNGRLEDICCGMFCACCSGIQLARQTHDIKEYSYQCCGPTGLPNGAPEIV